MDLIENDEVDSLIERSSDFNPIRNRANELHAKASGKKGRITKQMQAERGKRLGGAPPYGYKIKEAGSKEIVPDKLIKPVVQCIFRLCASGKGPCQIAQAHGGTQPVLRSGLLRRLREVSGLLPDEPIEIRNPIETPTINIPA